MKDIFLYLLIVVVLIELVTLGGVRYRKFQGKVLAVSTNQELITPTPSATNNVSTNDYLALLASPEATATEVASILLTPTLLPTLSPQPTNVPTTKPSVSPMASPTLSPKPSPTASITPQQKYSSQEINSFIDRFAGQYSVDPNIIRHIALCESGFNPLAKYLSYGGLFQFSASTWESYRKKMGEDTNSELRFNAEEAVQTAAYVLSIKKGGIWPNCEP